MADTRGSEKMLARCAPTIRDEHIGRIEAIVKAHEGRFISWQCLGQPAPDSIIADIELARLDSVGQLVHDLLGEPELSINLELFPYGIPYPDVYRIGLRAGGRL
jgi:hypothetical protein